MTITVACKGYLFFIENSGARGKELEVYGILNFEVNRNEDNRSPPYFQVESVALSVALHVDVEQGLFQCPSGYTTLVTQCL